MGISDEHAARLEKAIERLAKAADTLRRDTRTLAKLLCPDAKFEDEPSKSHPLVSMPITDIKDLYNRLRIHLDRLEAGQGDILKIRSLYAELTENMRSRTDWEPHVTARPPGRRKDDA